MSSSYRIGSANGRNRVEENVSIVVACVPTLVPLLAMFNDKIKSVRSRRNHSQISDLPSKDHHLLMHPMIDFKDSRPKYESLAVPARAIHADPYRDESGLLPGIQKKTTKMEVRRDEGSV